MGAVLDFVTSLENSAVQVKIRRITHAAKPFSSRMCLCFRNYKLLSIERGEYKDPSCRACVQNSARACVLMPWSPVRAPSQGLWDSFYCPGTCTRSNPAELGDLTGQRDPLMLALLPCVCQAEHRPDLTCLGVEFVILGATAGVNSGTAAVTHGTCFGFAPPG